MLLCEPRAHVDSCESRNPEISTIGTEFAMNSLNIDFRDGCLRILVTKDGSVKYSKLVKDFSLADLKSAKEKLASAIKEAGGKRGKVHIILPSDIITHKTFQIPAMEFEDAKKYIKREISKEEKREKFIVGMRRLVTHKKEPSVGQVIIAEYVYTADIDNYLGLLKSCEISPDIMTSGFEGNIHMFNGFRPETDGNEAVLDIGINMIEVTIINNGRLLGYQKLLLPHGKDEQVEGEDLPAEQSDKIKTYRIIDTLYKFIMAYGQDFPEENLSTLWICGIGSTIEGITDSISDGLGINCRFINPFDTEVVNGSAFSALKGISALKRKDIFINLIPEDILAARTTFLRRAVLAASLSFYIILLIAGYVTLNRTEKEFRILHDRIKSDQEFRTARHETDDIYSAGRNTFAKILLNNRGMYSVLRDIANLTPSGVTLTSLQVKKVQNMTHLEINATIQYTDENFKNALLSKFLTSLDHSSSMKRTSPPEIAISQSAAKQKDMQKEISVKATYEVVR